MYITTIKNTFQYNKIKRKKQVKLIYTRLDLADFFLTFDKLMVLFFVLLLMQFYNVKRLINQFT